MSRKYINGAGLLALLLTACGGDATDPADDDLEETGAAAVTPYRFYCGAATQPVRCNFTPAGPANANYARSMVTVVIDNHANGGQRCQLRTARGSAFTDWNYIDQGTTTTVLGTDIIRNTRFYLWCQRRSASGDAGIGGYLYVEG